MSKGSSQNVYYLFPTLHISSALILYLEPLELRRLRFDLINYYKILVLPQYSYLRDRFHIFYPPSSSRCCLPRLIRPANSQLCSSFFYRNIHVWNSLPNDLRTSTSLATFKVNLNRIDLTKFLKCSSLRE